jgi:hypothetical protein
MSPLAFIARPQRWLWAIHRYRGSLSASPNFGYELCLRRLKEKHLEGLDLGSWRGAMNGAEPVSPDTTRQFCERFRAYGLRSAAMMPVYGLAENSVGLTFPPLGRGPLIDRIQRDALMHKGQALPAAADDPTALQFAACGTPLDGHQVRIVDPASLELPERQEGHLQFRGPSATSGYFRNPEATAQLFQDDWLDSGDLAYVSEGEVYLTGRTKDIIIRAGRNIYPHELEEAVGRLDSIRAGRVTAFGSIDPKTGTERLILLAETSERDEQTLADLRTRINAVVTDLVGAPPDDVVLAPPHTILMTSSGGPPDRQRLPAPLATHRTGDQHRNLRHICPLPALPGRPADLATGRGTARPRHALGHHAGRHPTAGPGIRNPCRCTGPREPAATGSALHLRIQSCQLPQDFRLLAAKARAGRSYMFFSEGTFTRSPGMLRFHMGAFIAAAEAGVPIVPIAIRGTRSILRGTDWLPHRGSVQLRVEPAITAEMLGLDLSDPWKVAVALRDETRARILKHCGEPDLILEKPPF